MSSAAREQEFRETCYRALKHYGMPHQINILQEECGELVAAISHYRRNREGALDRLISELADVIIMTRQITLSIGPSLVLEAIERKLARLNARLDEEAKK